MSKNKPKIMTYEEYIKGIPHKSPHFFDLKFGENYLFYFGEKHSSDPMIPQWDEHFMFWNEFLEKTIDKKRICFIEGGIRPIASSRDESILKYGGMGLVSFLASQNKIEVISPEPDEKFERSELEKEFSREEVQYYYFSRVASHWSRKRHCAPTFEQYVRPYLESDQRKSGWKNFDFSLENMKRIHFKIFSKDFDPEDSEFLSKQIGLTIINSSINKVARKSNFLRDLHILQKIEEYLKLDFSIFIQFGSAHSYIQEPYLRNLNLSTKIDNI